MKPFRFLLLNSFLLVVAVGAQALTLGDIKVQVRQRIDDRADPKLRYSDAILLQFINEGQRDLVNRTWCLQKTGTDSLSVNTTYYLLPTDLIAIQEVNFKENTSGRTRQLEEKSERSLYQENPDYERQRGAPMYYFVRHSTHGSTQLQYGVNPVPSSASALGTTFIDYYNQSTDLAVNSEVPLDGHRNLYPYHTALIFYTVAQIKTLEGNTGEASAYLALYDATVKLMIDRLGMMPNYNPGFGVGTGK